MQPLPENVLSRLKVRGCGEGGGYWGESPNFLHTEYVINLRLVSAGRIYHFLSYTTGSTSSPVPRPSTTNIFKQKRRPRYKEIGLP